MPLTTSISFNNLKLPSRVEAIILAAPMPGLGRDPYSSKTSNAIAALSGKEIPNLCLAGLWLLAGKLDRSHQISQSDHSASGSYWHGIMHRREVDYWNANYWFRKAPRHAVLATIGEEIAASPNHDRKLTAKFLSSGRFDPAGLTDEVERCMTNQLDLQFFTEIAWLEWQHLFAHCWMESVT
jgi:hypothetical protein